MTEDETITQILSKMAFNERQFQYLYLLCKNTNPENGLCSMKSERFLANVKNKFPDDIDDVAAMFDKLQEDNLLLVQPDVNGSGSFLVVNKDLLYFMGVLMGDIEEEQENDATQH